MHPPFGVTKIVISRSTLARSQGKAAVPILGYPFDALGVIKTVFFLRFFRLLSHVCGRIRSCVFLMLCFKQNLL